MKKIIVVSGANLFSGGTLSIIQDCLQYANLGLSGDYKIIALVHDVNDFKLFCDKIELIEFKNVRKSYLHRLYYEYVYYRKLSSKLKPYLWISLNDISSNIVAQRRAVYCHNPTPFKKLVLSDIVNQTPVFFFTLFYKFLYKINIHKNDYVIVQQQWLRNNFAKMFSLSKEKIIVAPPKVVIDTKALASVSYEEKKIKKFCFPTFPRPFKNIEVIGEAVKLLIERGFSDFKVTITIDGNENKYAEKIIKKFNGIKQIDFIGLISREAVFELYEKSDCLIFPSLLETWGLPITEFKQYDKAILLSDLEYAHETLGDYDKAAFFNPQVPRSLADHMAAFMAGTISFQIHKSEIIQGPVANNWEELFTILLN